MRILRLLTFLTVATALQAAPEYPKSGPDIYDTQADGTAQVAAAVAQAKTAGKHVLVDLGANWCVWCHRLHDTFQQNPEVAAALEKNYILVLIDVNHRQGKSRNDAVINRYDNPTKLGVPVLLVLGGDGHLLVTQDSGALEDGKEAHDPAKIIAFLAQWAPKS
jgi:thiol:disulfide interchange protein